jgi:hypothetical protein
MKGQKIFQGNNFLSTFLSGVPSFSMELDISSSGPLPQLKNECSLKRSEVDIEEIAFINTLHIIFRSNNYKTLKTVGTI